MAAASKSRPVPHPFPLPDGRPTGNPIFLAQGFPALLAGPQEILSNVEAVPARGLIPAASLTATGPRLRCAPPLSVHDRATALRSASRARNKTSVLHSAPLRASLARHAEQLRFAAPRGELPRVGRWFSVKLAYKPCALAAVHICGHRVCLTAASRKTTARSARNHGSLREPPGVRRIAAPPDSGNRVRLILSIEPLYT